MATLNELEAAIASYRTRERHAEALETMLADETCMVRLATETNRLQPVPDNLAAGAKASLQDLLTSERESLATLKAAIEAKDLGEVG